MKKAMMVLFAIAMFVFFAGTDTYAEDNNPETDEITKLFEMAALYSMRDLLQDSPTAKLESISVYTVPDGYSGTFSYPNMGKYYSDTITEDSVFIRMLAHSINKYGISSDVEHVLWVTSFNRISNFSENDWKNFFTVPAVTSGGSSMDQWGYAMFKAALAGGCPFTETALDLEYLSFRYDHGGNIWQ